MEKTDENAPVQVTANVGAPDVFADRIVGVFLNNGNVHMTLASRRCDYSVTPNVFVDAVIGQLVMPMAAAENLAQFLTGFIDRMKKQPTHMPADTPRTVQ